MPTDAKPFTAEEITDEARRVNHDCYVECCHAPWTREHETARRYLATIRERDERIAQNYSDSMVAHRWFAKQFGEVMNGRDFAMKCPMATEEMMTLRARIEDLERRASEPERLLEP
jgi:hypothetical protein